MFKEVCGFCSMSRTNQQASFYNDEFNAYAFRHNAFGYISFYLHPMHFFREYVFQWELSVCFLQCQIIWMYTLFANKYLKVL